MDNNFIICLSMLATSVKSRHPLDFFTIAFQMEVQFEKIGQLHGLLEEDSVIECPVVPGVTNVLFSKIILTVN